MNALGFTGGTSGLKKKKMLEMHIQFTGQEDSLEEKVATSSSSLLGKVHGQRSLVGVHFMGQQSPTQLSVHAHTHNFGKIIFGD